MTRGLPLQRGLLHGWGGKQLTRPLVPVLRWFLLGRHWWWVRRASPDPVGGRCPQDKALIHPSPAPERGDAGAPTCRRPAF